MADEEAPEAGQEDAGRNGGRSGLLGPILALVVLLLLGAGLGIFVVSLLPQEDAAAADKQAPASEEDGNLLEDFRPILIGEVMANVPNEGGRRYSKVTTEIWVRNEDFEKVSKPEVQNILLEALEERLHSFDMRELSSEYIHTKLKSTFKDELDNKLREIFGEVNTDKTYVRRVVLTNLLVQ